MDEALPPLTPESLVPRIGEYLVEKGLISTDDLECALVRQQDYRKSQKYPPLLGQILVMNGKLTRADLDLAITEQIIQLRQALQNSNEELEIRVKERTKQLEEALQRLEAANQVKANFLGNISHELRTPLTHIRGYLDLLVSRDLGELAQQQIEALEIMLRSTIRLENLIEDLILFSDSQNENFALDFSSFSIHALATQLLKPFRNKAQELGIQFDYACDPHMPEALADKDKIGWVISHLLGNALKFTPAGGRIALNIEHSETRIRISVLDTGIGIPEERVDEIFEPFHQLDGSSTRRYGGTGLGLALAKQIIELHGSNLCVSSIPGQGSCFEFNINSGNTPDGINKKRKENGKE